VMQHETLLIKTKDIFLVKRKFKIYAFK